MQRQLQIIEMVKKICERVRVDLYLCLRVLVRVAFLEALAAFCSCFSKPVSVKLNDQTVAERTQAARWKCVQSTFV